MSEIKPFSPTEAKAAKAFAIPNEVIQATNELLAERYNDSGKITFTLKELKARCRKILGVDEMHSSENPMDNWPAGVWDIEHMYREQGWKVSYDRPAYCESYDSYFIFAVDKE